MRYKICLYGSKYWGACLPLPNGRSGTRLIRCMRPVSFVLMLIYCVGACRYYPWRFIRMFRPYQVFAYLQSVIVSNFFLLHEILSSHTKYIKPIRQGRAPNDSIAFGTEPNYHFVFKYLASCCKALPL
jgi:hypothetical protein